MSKILITGGAGYIGSHCVYTMLEKGFDVVVLDNLHRGYLEPIEVLQDYFDKKIYFENKDLRNIEDIRKVFDKHRDIQGVMHFAALCLVNESMSNPYKYFENNVYGSANLLEVMKEYKVKNFVFSSTCNVYKVQGDGQVNEKSQINPPNPYGESKYLSEKEALWYQNIFNFKVIIFRYFNVCGAHPDGLIGDSKKPSQLLMQNAVRGAIGIESFKYTYSEVDTFDKSPIRDYINVMDLSEAHFLAMQKLLEIQDQDEDLGQNQSQSQNQSLDQDEISGIYNLGTENGNSVKEIVEKVMQITGKKFTPQKGKSRKGEPSKLFADITKVRKVFGWEPKYSLEDSIKSLMKWYQKHPNGWEY